MPIYLRNEFCDFLDKGAFPRKSNIAINSLTRLVYSANPLPVHPGRGPGHDGDHRWGGCGACGRGGAFALHSGVSGKTRRHYDRRIAR